MNKIQTYISTFIAVSGICFTSCTNDNNIDWNGVEVTNTELRTILQQKGYTFNAEGKLVQDDKVKNTTSLDLSGTKIANLSGLEVLPHLAEVNLSNNEYGPVFDFSALPKNITAIDLSGNKIYDFKGLVDVKMVNDEMSTTVLHPLTKFYLPETAKYNIEDLVPFHAASAATDMQMQNANGTLQAYTTLRDIPDEYFRTYLKSKFASLFTKDGNQIDISKPMVLTEQGSGINIDAWYADNENIHSIEGLEYFINNPFYKPFYVQVECMNHCSVAHLMPRDNLKALFILNAETPEGIDLSQSAKLASFGSSNNKYLTELDLSKTLVTNQEATDFDKTVSNVLHVFDCENLKEIKFPEQSKGLVSQLELASLPSLKKMDLSFLRGFQAVILLQLENCTITYPNFQYVYSAAYETLKPLADAQKATILISENEFKQEACKTFLSTYKKNLNDSGYRDYSDYGAFRWTKKI